MPVHIQASCFNKAFAPDFDGLSAEIQAHFSKALGLPGTRSSVIKRFWHGSNYRPLDFVQGRMQRGVSWALAAALGVGGTPWPAWGSQGTMYEPAAVARGLLQEALHKVFASVPSSIMPTWNFLSSPDMMPACAGQTRVETAPAPKPYDLGARSNVPFLLFQAADAFSGVFQGDDRAFDLLLPHRATQRRNLLLCFQRPRALQRYVSSLIYRPPSLMTHSGKDLFVVSMTPTLVNKASLPSHQSGSYR